MISLQHSTTKEIIYVDTRSGYGSEWVQLGTAARPAGDASVMVLRSGAWVEDPAAVEALLIAAVNADRETRQMAVMTAGGAKKAVYALQQAEVLAWAGLGAVNATTTQLVAAFNLLPQTVRKQKFAFAVASAAKRGEPNIASAIGRFVAGAATSNAEVARVEAIARAAIDAIKAATTVKAKREAYSNINWSWQPA